LIVDKIKRHYLYILIPSVVISIVIFFLWVKHNEEKIIGHRINQHIKIVNISDSMGDLTKRAEENLYLLLMINNADKKFEYLKNIDSLKNTIATLTVYEYSDTLRVTANELKQSAVSFIYQSNTILDIYESRSPDFYIFSSSKFIKKIDQFHETADDVRKLSLTFVDSSDKLLKSDNILIEDAIGFKNELLIIFSVLINFLIFIVFYLMLRLRAHKNKMISLSELSYVDSLTGIGNRRKFDNEFEKQWKISTRTGKGFYLLMLDIDYFKNFNDYYGHTEGDRCLKKVSHLLRNMVSRQTDTVCRYGGEEFAIILSESSNVIDVAEKCRKGIEGLKISNKNSDISEYLTLSIGAGEVLGNVSENYTDGIKKIDIALYLAKRQGRNQVVNV